MNPIKNIEDLYNYLQHLSYKITDEEKNNISDFLTQQFAQTEPEEFITALNARERQAIKESQVSLCHIMLTKHALSIPQTKAILEKFSDETLRQSDKPLHCRFINPADINTPLGMALMGCDKKADYYFQEEEHSEIQLQWRDNIVYYLLDERNLSPDTDILIGGKPLLIYCLLSIKDNLKLFYPLAVKIIDKSCDINRQDLTFGGTALNHAAAMGAAEMVQQLLSKGADFTIGGCNGWNSITKKTPLLLATERRRGDCVKLLLEAGASPNEMPNKPQTNISFFQEEKVLTPYQTAVEMKDHELISIFVSHAKHKGIKLQTTLDPYEQARRDAAGITQPENQQTLGAQAEAEAIRSPENLLTTIYSQFHLRCYVESPADRKDVEKALQWLLSPNDTVVSKLWNPIRNLVLAECSYNDELSMFVYAAGRDVAGCFNAETQNDFYIEGGQSERAFTHVIAHELGHYFAARKTGRIPVPSGFEAAYLQDKARYDNGEAPHFLLKSLLEYVAIGESYASDTAKLAEYFTRACVQFPIRLYLQDPNISAQDFATILNKSMPHMFDYFQSKFIQKSSMVKAVPESPELRCSN